MGIFLILGLAGGVGGAVFWFVRRPDHDEKPPQD